VEVKTRSSEEFGTPESAVDSRKRRLMVRAAGEYLRRAGLEWGCARFDTVGVVWDEPIRIEVYRDAFSPRTVAGPVSRY